MASEKKSDDLILTPLSEAFLPILIDTVNHPDIGKWLPFHSPFNDAQAQKILAKAQDKTDDYCVWMIEAKQQMVGTIVLQSQWHPGCIQLGYWIDPQYHRRGYGFAAVQLLCDTAYDQLSAVRVQAQVHTDNTASIALLEKLGFKREAMLPLGAAKMNDTPADCYLYAQLRSEVE